MLWLEATQKYRLYRDDSNDHVIPWVVDVRAVPDYEDEANHAIDSYIVGRFLADEIRRFEVEEWGETAWDVADADSAGLELAYSALADDSGRFRAEDFEGIADPFIYLYAFGIHPDFSIYRRSIVDGFCRLFPAEAVILTGTWVHWMSLDEFGTVGLHPWHPTSNRQKQFHARSKLRDVGGDLSTILVRDNTIQTKFDPIRFVDEHLPPATQEHEDWVEKEIVPLET